MSRHRFAVIALLLPATFATSAARALDDDPTNRPIATDGRTQSAPVGHRQPTAADVPVTAQTEARDTESLKRDRELDKKLRICRGC
jgi:hypothetical protein